MSRLDYLNRVPDEVGHPPIDPPPPPPPPEEL